jgi:predicted phosphate transport protein (TIGR00153 family)
MFKVLRKKNDEKFYRIFEQMTVYILEAAEVLQKIVTDSNGDHQALAVRIKELEHRGDDLTHTVIGELNKTFVTPIDREDIHDLCLTLDDVLDMIDATAARIVLFKIKDPIHEVPEIANVLLNQAKEIAAAVKQIRDNDHVMRRCVEINRLENDADRLFQSAIGRLFEEVKDPIAVIKRKEIIESLEKATDRAEDVSNVLESIVVKYA